MWKRLKSLFKKGKPIPCDKAFIHERLQLTYSRVTSYGNLVRRYNQKCFTGQERWYGCTIECSSFQPVDVKYILDFYFDDEMCKVYTSNRFITVVTTDCIFKAYKKDDKYMVDYESKKVLCKKDRWVNQASDFAKQEDMK